jgi:putative addiction module component (TIGR02574 family)
MHEAWSCSSTKRPEAAAWTTLVRVLADMVKPDLRSAIEAMSLDERLELVEYIESTVESVPIEVTEEQKAMIRSRAAELRKDPSTGLTWDELNARLGSRWA